jgi:hypothetical protein
VQREALVLLSRRRGLLGKFLCLVGCEYWVGKWGSVLVRFFLFFLASAEAAAGPLDSATRAVVVVLAVASLEDGIDDMVGALCWEGWGGISCAGGVYLVCVDKGEFELRVFVSYHVAVAYWGSAPVGLYERFCGIGARVGPVAGSGRV